MDAVVELEINGKRVKVRPISEDMLEHTARIIGEQGAAGRALSEMRERRRGGEDVYAFIALKGDTILVGPKP